MGNKKQAHLGNKNKAYLGLSWLVSLILAIIPVTNIILGIVTRVSRGKILLAVLNFFLFFIFYFIDLVSIILYDDLQVLA